MPWFLRGLRDGVLTTGWPRRPDPYFDQFPAAVAVRRGAAPGPAALAAARDCPTGAIGADGAVTVDRGRCILCGRCVRGQPGLFGWSPGAGTAAGRRAALVTGGDGSQEAVAAVRGELARRVRCLRRSVHIRHVDAGSDGSDEWEVQALLNPVYDVHRLGIFFTASPRHADILLVTGIGAAGMREPLARTRAAMPDPVVVIAAGDARPGGLGQALDVDVWVPGSPASPFSLLHGILLALGRLPGTAPTPAEPGGR
jgi:Ni,Fe-hydrogenase III small subunit/ferredoxin